jgi:glucokinase
VRILVGDIGGTNTRLALFDGHALDMLSVHQNQEIHDIHTMVQDYASDHGPMDAVVLGIAGPVVGESVSMVNYHWTISAKRLRTTLDCPIRLLNDFHAQAFGVPHLANTGWIALDDIPYRTDTHMAVIGVGTGLGEAMCIWSPSGWLPIAGEGSHGRFAPQNENQIKVLRGLQERWPDHVSVERIVSGPGLLNTYDVLRGSTARHPDLAEGDPSAAITGLALSGLCPIASRTLEVFVDVFADEAATLALKCAAGVVYLTGGIPPRLKDPMATRFRTAFENKGRYRQFMASIPVRLVTEPYLGLLGAGIAGAEMIGSQDQR